VGAWSHAVGPLRRGADAGSALVVFSPALFDRHRPGARAACERHLARFTGYLRTRQGRIWMLTLYPKNVAENISANVLKQIKGEIDG